MRRAFITKFPVRRGRGLKYSFIRFVCMPTAEPLILVGLGGDPACASQQLMLGAASSKFSISSAQEAFGLPGHQFNRFHLVNNGNCLR